MDDHFDLDSLGRFTGELASIGFRLVPESSPQRWTGKIYPSFAPLTGATTMDVVIAPGWPFQPPLLLVEGLNTNHSTLNGMVCMWRDGDVSDEWTTVDGLFTRIEEWCENAKRGWEDDRLDQDAFLNFGPNSRLAATFDLSALGIAAGSWGECHGLFGQGRPRVDIMPGPKRSGDHLRGLWFHAGSFERAAATQTFGSHQQPPSVAASTATAGNGRPAQARFPGCKWWSGRHPIVLGASRPARSTGHGLQRHVR